MPINKESYNIALLASGNGTNVERIATYFHGHPFITIDSVFYNRKNAYVAERAKQLGLHPVYLPDSVLNDNTSIANEWKRVGISHLVLAGFLSKIPHHIIDAYQNHIINIHPALLPKYGGQGMFGMHVHQKVVESKDSESGISIHLVNEHYDQGNILFQSHCKVAPSDTPGDVAQKVHALEYKHYPEIIEKWILKTL